MIPAIATPYLDKFAELTKDIDFEDPQTEAGYQAFLDLDHPENFGSASVAFMRLHLTLKEMLPLVQMLHALGSDSPFIAMYEAMATVQKDMSEELLNSILAESKVHAGITEEDLNA